MELSALYKFPGVYRGYEIDRDGSGLDGDYITMKAKDEGVVGDLYAFAWPGTNEPFCVVKPDDKRDVGLMVLFEKYNHRSGEWEVFDTHKALLELAKNGQVKLSKKWVADIMEMRKRSKL